MTTSRSRVIAVLVFVQICFATLPVAGKMVMREMSSQALVLIRVGVAAIIFYALHRLMSNERIRSTADYGRLALYSVLGVSLNQLLFLIGLNYTTATAAQMLLVAGPAIALGTSILLKRERGSVRKWLGIVLASCGALTLIGVMPPMGRVGNIIILANVTSYALYLVLARDIARRYEPLTVITWIFIFGALALLPVGIVPLVREIGGISQQAQLGIVWIILFPTVAAYFFNMWSLTKVEPSLVSTFVYLQPLLTVSLALPLLGERPTIGMLPSAVLIFAGVALAIREQRITQRGPDPGRQAVVEV
jgi:drug/metabolite transporter (DMT)-like permease